MAEPLFTEYAKIRSGTVDEGGATDTHMGGTGGKARHQREASGPQKEGSGMDDLLKRIAIDPTIRNGKPIIRGTRITVSDILEYLAGGMSEEEILADFPDLAPEDIKAALAFAAQRERRLFVAP